MLVAYMVVLHVGPQRPNFSGTATAHHHPMKDTDMDRLIDAGDPLAVAATQAVQQGDAAQLRQLLTEHPELAVAAIGTVGPRGMTRTLLHVATDWPGHYPNVVATIALLIEAGAEVNARFTGPHTETPLHWAASCDDVDALDALLDAGAEIEADGAVHRRWYTAG